MCGRYASHLPAELLARVFRTANALPNLKPTWNMTPTLEAPVVRLDRDSGHRHLDVMVWGLLPAFTKAPQASRKPINARSESIERLPTFRDAFAERRCLVPAAAYYEWRTDSDGKAPFAVARVDGDPVAFAGIWEEWQAPEGEMLRTFATITTDANRKLSTIQDRMPVILEPEDWAVWLGEADGDVKALLRPAPEDALRFWPVGKEVGNVKNDGPELLQEREHIEEQPALL